MTPFDILIFGLAILAGQFAGAWVQALAAIRTEAKRLLARDANLLSYRETARRSGCPFYDHHPIAGHVAVFPQADGGEVWFMCPSSDEAIAFLEPHWRAIEAGAA
jgi:hypothetical protein